MNTQANGGFSLIESLVVISIIGILTSLSLAAFPAIRSHQELLADTESIRALLLDAKQRTLNQVRPEQCLPGLDVEDILRAECSDTGVAIVNDEIIEFANTRNSDDYTYDAGAYPSGDFVLTRSNLSSQLDIGSASVLLFVGTPPSATLYKDGSKFTGSPSTPAASIKLIASNGTQRTIKVYSFGTIDIQ